MTTDSGIHPQLLSTPLPCWHESLVSARTDLIVALSPRSARITTTRPLPAGTAVYLELGDDATIDGVTTDGGSDDSFVVAFITVDDAASTIIKSTLDKQAPELAPPAMTAMPRTRTDELFGAESNKPLNTPRTQTPTMFDTQAVTQVPVATPAVPAASAQPWARSLQTDTFVDDNKPFEHTQRWPAARAVVEKPAPEPAPEPSRPLPAVELSSDDIDVANSTRVISFRADGDELTETELVSSTGRIQTPQPVTMSLPRTPSMFQPSTPLTAAAQKNPFGGDSQNTTESGVVDIDMNDSAPSIQLDGDAEELVLMPLEAPDEPTAQPAASEQWVATGPSLFPSPRLLDRDFDPLLKSGGSSSSATPKPVPFSSSPPIPLPLIPGVSVENDSADDVVDDDIPIILGDEDGDGTL